MLNKSAFRENNWRAKNNNEPWAMWVEGVNHGIVRSRIAVHHWNIRQQKMLTEQIKDAWRERPHLYQVPTNVQNQLTNSNN